MKKRLVMLALLAATVFATGAGFDTSATPPAVSNEEMTFDVPKIKESVIVHGIVKEIKDGKIVITTEDNPENITFLNIRETYFIDMLAGDYTDIKSVIPGEPITVYCSPIAPMIYPPQLNAQLILLNVAKEGAAAFRIVTGEKFVNENPDVILSGTGYISSDEEYIVWFYEDSDITDNMGNKINISDITEGMEMLVWSDMVMTSLPAQANAKKAVVLNYANETIDADTSVEPKPIVISGENLILNGDIVYNVMEKNKAFTTDKNVTLYPVRAIAEALENTVEWDNGTVSIFTRNISRSSFKIGENNYSFSRAFGFLNEGNTFQIVNGNAYAPKEFFERVFNCYFE